jgi:hypothetical protein
MWQLMLNINFPSMPVVIRFRILWLALCCYEYIKLKTYQTIILYFVFNWFETRLVTLMEVYRTSIFMNRVQRKIFSLKREEMTGGRRKLYMEFHDIHSSPDLVKEDVMGGTCCTYRREFWRKTLK